MQHFWRKPLEQLSQPEWEALCDGCGRCCLHKLQNEEGELFWTSVACGFLDIASCRCKDYVNRLAQVPTCLDIRPALPSIVELLPATCAYRLRYFNRPLPAWHPLLSKNRATVRYAGLSVSGFAHSERDLPDTTPLEDFILENFE